MMEAELLVVGASGHGRVVADTARAMGWHVRGHAVVFDDQVPTHLLGTSVGSTSSIVAVDYQGILDLVRDAGVAVVLGFGDNPARRRLFLRLRQDGVRAPSIVHPHSWVSPSAVLGPGAVVLAGCVVQAQAEVGANVILNTSVSVDHDCVVGDHAHLSPGVHLGGGARIGAGAWLGVGCSVRDRVEIGPGTLVGVGSAVVTDLPGGVVAYGVPARVRRPLQV